MNYDITKEASGDLESIWEYSLETWSVEQADKYINLLLDEMERLCLFPLSGKDFSSSGIEYRASKVKSHLIFYKIIDKKTLKVVRVLHENMDFLDCLID